MVIVSLIICTKKDDLEVVEGGQDTEACGGCWGSLRLIAWSIIEGEISNLQGLFIEIEHSRKQTMKSMVFAKLTSCLALTALPDELAIDDRGAAPPVFVFVLMFRVAIVTPLRSLLPLLNTKTSKLTHKQ